MPAPVPNVCESLKTGTIKTDGGLRIDQFIDPPPTPGNVAVCLSGGGSRAMTAGMGQLRALKHLQLGDASLLAQTRALSTVSGGSWIGQTFSYLDAPTSDDALLNRYVSDPARLVPTATPGHALSETLDALPVGNIGRQIGTRLFSPAGLAVSAFILWQFFDVPANMLWQTLIGGNILRPYRLYDPARQLAPASLFSFDRRTLEDDVLKPNPGLAQDERAMHLIASGPTRVHRPFPICNMAMFLKSTAGGYEFLAPVQSTPFLTGVLGLPQGTDQNGRPVGGGGVTSFGFSSEPDGVEGDLVRITQSRQWALTDSIGTSSAFYAEVLQNLFKSWSANVDQFYANAGALSEELEDWLLDLLTAEFGLPSPAALLVVAALSELNARGLEERRNRSERVFRQLGLDRARLTERLNELAIKEIIPSYDYWSVQDPTPVTEFRPTRFADGGNLDNSGICGALAYEDIDNLIAFANTSTPLATTDYGVLDQDGREVPGTRVMVTESLPALFGYQPYRDGVGYRLYAGDASPTGPAYQHNQVFPSHEFPNLLRALWRNSGNEAVPGSNQHVAMARLDLDVLPNAWFGIKGGKQVGVLWLYNNRARDWYDALSADVRAILGDFDDPASYFGFPNYSTFQTDLDATQVNLLAHFSAWAVASEQCAKEAILDLYRAG